MMRAQYYRINLNKASNRLDQFQQSRKIRKFIALAVFFVVMLAGIGVLVYKGTQAQKVIADRKAELASIQDKINQLETSSDFLSPEDIYTLANVTKSRLIWSEKLAMLGNALPRDVAITQLGYDESLKAFLIKGISKVKADMKDLDLVVSIIDLIKAQQEFSKDFSEIKFQSSQRVKRGEQEIVKFEIACLLKS